MTIALILIAWTVLPLPFAILLGRRLRDMAPTAPDRVREPVEG